MNRVSTGLGRARVRTRAHGGADPRREAGPRSDGYSLTEVLVVMGILTLIMTAAVVAWGLTRGRAETKAAARLTRTFVGAIREKLAARGVVRAELEPSSQPRNR